MNSSLVGLPASSTNPEHLDPGPVIFQAVDSTGPTADHQASGPSVVIAPDIQNAEPHIVPGNGPAITARLANDASSDSADHLTSAPAVAGKVTDSDHDFIKLTAGFDQAPATGFIDLTSHVNADGSFLLDQNLLRSIAGGTLADGMHTLNLVASDSEGKTGTRSVRFALDTDAPTLTARLADDTGGY